MKKRGNLLEKVLSKRAKGKRAQFYLIAAIIIVSVLIGLATITNYIRTKKEPTKFYDLSEELSEEGSRVIDYGIYNEKDLPKIVENFTDEYFVEYSEEKIKGSELVFVYGNQNNVTVSSYTSENTGTVSIDYGTSSFDLTGSEKYVVNRTSYIPSSPYGVKVRLLGVEYDFSLKEGENFFFVINRNTTEEIYIVKNPT